MTISRAHKRLTTLIATLLGASLALTACSDGGGDVDTDNSEPTPDEDTTSNDDYPVTVGTYYGPITLEEKPETIVAFNRELADSLHAIDEPAVFSSGGVDEEDYLETSGWFSGLYAEYDPETSTAEWKPSPEGVVAHEPDLIVVYGHTIDDALHEQLSQIAPVYAADIDPAAFGWRHWVTDFGKLTGKSEKAGEVIEEVEAELEGYREHLSGLQGATFNGAYHLAEQEELRMVGAYYWPEDIGLALADNQPESTDEPLHLSLENLDQFAGDVITIMTDDEGQAALEADPRFSGLPAVENGTVIWADQELGGTMTAYGPTGLLWLLEQVVPQLEESDLNQNGQ